MPNETHATIYHPAALAAFRHLFKPKGKVEAIAVPRRQLIGGREIEQRVGVNAFGRLSARAPRSPGL